MKNLNYQTGKVGENFARQFLVKKGYQIIESNFRTRFGEIDLIATKDKKLIFIEAKSKIGEDFGSPEEMVGRAKLGQIQQMAEYFIQTHPQLAIDHPSWQIDAVCIVLNSDQSVNRLNHWENIGNEME